MDVPTENAPRQISQGGSFFQSAHNVGIGSLNQTNIGNDQYIIDQQINVASPQTMGLLGILNPIPDATYTRNRKTSPPDSSCVHGTREEVIQKVASWADSSTLRNTAHVMWLYGYVGCGKSAIAQEVAQRYARKKRLAASFFFFRGSGYRSRTVKFAATLAQQVAGAIPATSRIIETNVKMHAGLLQPSTSVTAQLQHLVYDPIKAVKWDMMRVSLLSGPYIIVIDGLDECEDRDDIASIIDQMLAFFKENPRIPLRFLITSRVEEHIRTRLDPTQVHLLNLVDHTSLDDIATAFRAIFALAAKHSRAIQAYGEWPTPSDLELLVLHTGCSFIFMSTIARFVLESSGDGLSPIGRLPQALNINPGLDGLYDQTLSRAEHLPHFPDVVWTIALAEKPLSIMQLADLFAIRPFEVIDILVQLHAILQIPGDDTTPITLCHSSLLDFLTIRSRAGRFHASLSYHERIAHMCMQVLATYYETGDKTPAFLYAESNWEHHWRQFSQTVKMSRDAQRDAALSVISHLRQLFPLDCESDLASWIFMNPPELPIDVPLQLALDPRSFIAFNDEIRLNNDDIPVELIHRSAHHLPSTVLFGALRTLREQGSLDNTDERHIWNNISPTFPPLHGYHFDLFAILTDHIFDHGTPTSNLSYKGDGFNLCFADTEQTPSSRMCFAWSLLSWPQHLVHALRHVEPTMLNRRWPQNANSKERLLSRARRPTSRDDDHDPLLYRVVCHLCTKGGAQQRMDFISSVRVAMSVAPAMESRASTKRSDWHWVSSGPIGQTHFWLEYRTEPNERTSFFNLLQGFITLAACLEEACNHQDCPIGRHIRTLRKTGSRPR